MADQPFTPMDRMQQVCPARGCELAVDINRICCPTHWAQLPYSVQRKVWEAVRSGHSENVLAWILAALAQRTVSAVPTG